MVTRSGIARRHELCCNDVDRQEASPFAVRTPVSTLTPRKAEWQQGLPWPATLCHGARTFRNAFAKHFLLRRPVLTESRPVGAVFYASFCKVSALFHCPTTTHGHLVSLVMCTRQLRHHMARSNLTKIFFRRLLTSPRSVPARIRQSKPEGDSDCGTDMRVYTFVSSFHGGSSALVPNDCLCAKERVSCMGPGKHGRTYLGSHRAASVNPQASWLP